MNSFTKIDRVLIANRGAIAVRIIRTLREMGIESVAIYADVDQESLHVRLADHKYSLGEGTARDTYLNQDKILAIALESGAQAVHPGYGFLSENTAFVQRCEQHDIVFLGPTIDQIEAFGLKHRARALAEKSGVPLLPGTAVLRDESDALTQAERIGYPIMLKSSAGGGGIGMQLCHSREELQAAFSSVAQLSENNFSNSALFLEKFVERARHIEVQIFGDGQGEVLTLGERDCSAQRRNQKVLEETPAPNLSDNTRSRLHEIAEQLMCSVSYRSAGTVEFILDADTEEFYFLEVNTRLQVEHGVTEEIYGVDIVCWMLQLAMGQLPAIATLAKGLSPNGHAVQARVYAEDPVKEFQPSAGLLSEVTLPTEKPQQLRIDHWIDAGINISAFFDPMLAKVIAVGATRESALDSLRSALSASSIYGIETNLAYLTALVDQPEIRDGRCLTSTLSEIVHCSDAFEVLVPGTLTTIQDYPGRQGFWHVGVPPSGPFDSRSFRLGNRLLGNAEDAAGLEMTIVGVTLRFRSDAEILLAGAEMTASIDDQEIEFLKKYRVRAGETLKIGQVLGAGARSYLLVKGGIQCPNYLGSKSTFALGQFGGHAGRALRVGDVLHLSAQTKDNQTTEDNQLALTGAESVFTNEWVIRVTAGPQTSPEYFTEAYLQKFYAVEWEVHYNSSRTGIRLIGPRPEWSREDGGEAGMHPSNIHDNPYALGAVDFTGDMPVILGPDGPSLGGFVCPAIVTTEDLWKLGQLRSGDKIKFVEINRLAALEGLRDAEEAISGRVQTSIALSSRTSSISMPYRFAAAGVDVMVSPSGDSYLLVEFGDHVLDIRLRFLVHRLMLLLQDEQIPALIDLTPGIRSLQLHYDPLAVDVSDLVEMIERFAQAMMQDTNQKIASRIVHLPLSWDDPVCGVAIDKYQRSVRENAPWYPSNIEFIRRINGFDTQDEIADILLGASYLVMGLGDVYLGAPVATPIDPRHRLVTTKYNPARTWTAENSVGIGGAYLCVYGMEGPGGYQLVGRTLQMWNRYRSTPDFSKPWLLRFFDQIKFHLVSSEELEQIRRDLPTGAYRVRIEETEFGVDEYQQFLGSNHSEIDSFVKQRESAFASELARWRDSDQFNFDHIDLQEQPDSAGPPAGAIGLNSPVAGSIWKINVSDGDLVEPGDSLMVLESMKMEVEVAAEQPGRVTSVLHSVGSQVQAGQTVVYLEPL